MSEAFRRYIAELLRLHAALIEFGDEHQADEIRDRMDGTWWQLQAGEREQASGLSEVLNRFPNPMDDGDV